MLHYKTPFGKSLRNNVIKLLLAVIVPLAIYALIKDSTDAEWLFWIQSCAITYFSFDIAVSLINYIRFTKIKKKIFQ